MNIIATQLLQFDFGKQKVIKSLNLQVPQGSIYGFLGPNGAGKSTTIKLLLGLLQAKSGEIKIFQQSMPQNKLEILSKVGNLIESPSLYLHLNAWDNLHYLDILFKKGKKRIEEVLELVNLKHAAQKKVQYFSMGMKQRLGIAMALFHDPDLLILDEPVNGLDPAGIKEIRYLLFKLRDMGKTVFISSHLLSEIEKTCTHIGIIQKGELLFQGETKDFLKSTTRNIQLKVSDLNTALQVAKMQSLEATIKENALSIAIPSDEDFNGFIQALVHQNVAVFDIERESAGLEELFISMTKENVYA